MKTPDRPHLMLLAVALTGCVAESPLDDLESIDDVEPRLIPGQIYDESCSVEEVAAISEAVTHVLDTLTVGYDDFRACMGGAVLVENDGDTVTQIVEQLFDDDITHFYCADLPGDTSGQASVGIFGEEMTLDHGHLAVSSAETIADTIVHEIMHNKGYEHAANPVHSPRYNYTVPQQVGACVHWGTPYAWGPAQATCYADECSGYRVLRGYRSTTTGLAEHHPSQLLAAPLDDDTLLVGDFDGDGGTDFATVGGVDGLAVVRVQTAAGIEFDYQPEAYPLAAHWSATRWLVGDFDGDGTDDLVNVYGGPDGIARAWVHRSTGSGFEYQTSFTTLASYWSSQRWLAGDVDGDGRDDLVNLYSNPSGQARAWVHASTGSGFEYQTSFTPLASYWSSQRWLMGDFDGDGRDDLVNVYGNPAGEARAWVHASTGSGFEYQSSFTTLAGFTTAQRWLTGDIDGDGRDDLVNVYGNAGNPARAWIHESTGSGFEYQSSFKILKEFFSDQGWLVGDFDGDGREDLLGVTVL